MCSMSIDAFLLFSSPIQLRSSEAHCGMSFTWLLSNFRFYQLILPIIIIMMMMMMMMMMFSVLMVTCSNMLFTGTPKLYFQFTKTVLHFTKQVNEQVVFTVPVQMTPVTLMCTVTKQQQVGDGQCFRKDLMAQLTLIAFRTTTNKVSGI